MRSHSPPPPVVGSQQECAGAERWDDVREQWLSATHGPGGKHPSPSTSLAAWAAIHERAERRQAEDDLIVRSCRAAWVPVTSCLFDTMDVGADADADRSGPPHQHGPAARWRRAASDGRGAVSDLEYQGGVTNPSATTSMTRDASRGKIASARWGSIRVRGDFGWDIRNSDSRLRSW